MSSKQLTLFLSTALLLGTATAYSQITPSGITLGPSQQQQFKVPGQQQWTWSIVPTTVGTISPTGLYTAPAIYQSSYVYVYARSGSMYNQTELHLSQGMVSATGAAQAVGISVSPASIYLYGGQSAQFSASVSGTANGQVMWSISQGLGSIVNGLYTAPSSVSSDSLVTILATSLADPNQIGERDHSSGTGHYAGRDHAAPVDCEYYSETEKCLSKCQPIETVQRDS